MLFYGWWLYRWNVSITYVQWSFCKHQWCIIFSEKIATPLSTWFRINKRKLKFWIWEWVVTTLTTQYPGHRNSSLFFFVRSTVECEYRVWGHLIKHLKFPGGHEWPKTLQWDFQHGAEFAVFLGYWAAKKRIALGNVLPHRGEENFKPRP